MVTSPDGLRPRSRREVDVEEQKKGIELDRKAEEVIRSEVPAEVLAQLDRLVASVGNPTTRSPLRRALWLLSQGKLPRIWGDRIPKAYRIYQQSDAIYWGFALRHERLLHTLATIHARKSVVLLDEVLSAVQEAPYRAAILWDPSRGAYTTALTWQVRALWQRAPERQSAVSLPTHRMIGADLKGFGKVSCLSLDVPRSNCEDDGDLWVDSLQAEATESLHSEADIKRVKTLVRRLSDRCQDVLWSRAEGLTLREAGARLGVSRERARQLHEDGMGEIRDRLRLPTPPTVERKTKLRPASDGPG